MATLTWQSMAVALPGNGDEVWIRILNYYGPPFLARWDEHSQTFTTSVTSLVIPGYYIARWRFP